MRFTDLFDTLPARVRNAPQRYGTRAMLIAGAGVAAAIVLLAYLLMGNSQGDRVRPPPQVVVATAVSRDVTVVEHAMGTVVANATVNVTAQVTGQLLRADFREGQIVKKGDLLFEIDPRPFEAALAEAHAQLAKDAALLVKARNDEKRYSALFAQNAVSVQQQEQAVATADSTAAAVAADRAAVAAAEINLGYTKIRAPFDGKTGPILIQPGNLIAANGANPLVVLTQIEPVKVSFALPQSDLPRIQTRDRAGTLRALLGPPGGERLSAPVDFVSNQVNDQTGTIEMRASFDNRDHRLVPGQMVEVDVTLDNLRQATVVPREAVNEGPEGRYIFVVSAGGVAEMRPVRVLFDDGKNMAVQGVRRGETVVIDGQLRVVPGARVNAAKPRRTAK